MTRQTSSVRIAPQTDQPNLSKGQKAFNTLVKKIEASRKDLGLWQAASVAYQQKVASDCMPLLKTFSGLRIDLLHALDRALDRHVLTKAERRVVQNHICEMADDLIGQTGDESLKALYNKHSDGDFDAEQVAAAQALKSNMADIFGLDLGDGKFDPTSPEDLIEKIQAEMEKAHLIGLEEEDRRSQRKKTPRQQARAEKAKLEADTTSLSIREVYRKLASALHPDREPDAAERARKTGLMQRVNQAYGKKDLLQLLELQLELEHIDAKAISGLSEDRLKHFNKILKEQLAELEQEILQFEMPLRAGFNLPPYMALLPGNVLPYLLRDMADMRRDIKRVKIEMEVTQDLNAFKGWIKIRKQEAKTLEKQMRESDDFPFF